MKLEINFKNSKYCEGCPCLLSNIFIKQAWCFYFNQSLKFKGNFKKYVKKNNITFDKIKVLKLQKCIKENGK